MNKAAHGADDARHAMGFLGWEEVLALFPTVMIPEPRSVLVSRGVALGDGAVLWPNTILQASGGGRIVIGTGAQLFPGTRIVGSDGSVVIGSDAEIGKEGGFTIKAEAGEAIEIGPGARLLGGGSLTSSNRIGGGAQILGPIRCRDCRLGDGESYRHPDPDRRGGVLKGSGVARGMDVPQGHVVQAFGLFSEGVLRRQTYFHPESGG